MYRVLMMLAMMAVASLVHGEGVDPAEDEARIEELIRLHAEAVRKAPEGAPSVAYALPPPVAEMPELAPGMQPGPVDFAELPKLKGRWIAVRLKSGSVRRGELISVADGVLMLRIGSGAQGATLPFNRKNIRSLELLP